MELLCRSRRRDQQGPDRASSSIIISTAFYMETHSSVFFQSPEVLRLCKGYAQKNFHLHRPTVEHRGVSGELLLTLPLTPISRQPPPGCSVYTVRWRLATPSRDLTCCDLFHGPLWRTGCILKVLQKTETTVVVEKSEDCSLLRLITPDFILVTPNHSQAHTMEASRQPGGTVRDT